MSALFFRARRCGHSQNIFFSFTLALLGAGVATVGRADGNALEKYVARPDATFAWTLLDRKQADGFTVIHLELVSQTWREQEWRHHLQIVRPEKVRHPGVAFLSITGDGDGSKSLGQLKVLAERAGALAAVLTQIPNQPLYDGRKEDALIAYTFDQFLHTGDDTWPLLFPMVKGAVRAMDAVQAFAQKEFNQKVEQFIVSGASKRGWTTWLAGAVDPRVKAIAPMVIDMLNMKTQAQWAAKIYGRQSEKIKDYTDLNLVEKMDDPRMATLRSWVDPYSYRARYTMPKLLLLGTNDPYWTVDSLRHYWNDLPGLKLIFQTPNAGHDLGGGREAMQTLAAWFQMLADGQPLPKMEWQFEARANGPARLSVKVNQTAKAIRLWTADSPDRDFRDDPWTSRDLEIQPGSSKASTGIERPAQGYRASLAEVELTTPDGHAYKLSTEARVTPDDVK